MVFLCFLITPWAFQKQLFWIIYWANHRSVSLGLVTRKKLYSFGGIISFIFHVLEILYFFFACEEAITSSIFTYVFSRGIIYVSPVGYFLLDLSFGCTCSTLLVPSWSGILKTVWFLSIPQKSVHFLTVSCLIYLRQCWMLKFLCFLSVPQVAFCMCSVTICRGLYLLLYKELAMDLGSSWGRCAVCWGCLWASWEEFQARCPH